MKIAIGKKLGMSRLFDSDGRNVPVSLIGDLKGKLSRKKSEERDGYKALVIEYDDRKSKKLICEFKIKTDKEIENSVGFESFKENEIVHVEGGSRGKGFSGVIKRHGFSRGPMSHGSDHHRRPGSIGGAYPQRVVKGRKMPGRMGNSNVKIFNLKIMSVDKDNNLMIVRGSIPGAKNSVLKIIAE